VRMTIALVSIACLGIAAELALGFAALARR
jgi:hypothetical protein